MDITELKLKPISENEMISIFLKGEVSSKRFAQDVLGAIKKLNTNKKIVLHPNLSNTNENRLRKEILEETRSYSSRQGLFDGLPEDIKWYRAEVGSELLINEVMYINYDYWVELTNGSRIPKDAVENILTNKMIFNVPYDNFLDASDYFKKNKTFDEIILVSDSHKLVVLEGHLRLTVYALNRKILPKTIPVILGISKQMKDWDLF